MAASTVPPQRRRLASATAVSPLRTKLHILSEPPWPVVPLHLATAVDFALPHASRSVAASVVVRARTCLALSTRAPAAWPLLLLLRRLAIAAVQLEPPRPPHASRVLPLASSSTTVQLDLSHTPHLARPPPRQRPAARRAAPL
ncbi:hypothetical protein ZWY2020_019287 [Hordeum vulgare]|nr:hypothetical protein ZWY2020_019287 [Hordeum vulgare]